MEITANTSLKTVHLTRWATIRDTKSKENPDKDVNALDMILSQIETGFRIANFKEIMVVLQNEPNKCFIEEIRKSDSLMVAKLNEI